MPFSAADVFAALGAITAGTIALQVMAQTAHLEPSRTLAESNRRHTMAMLALLSPAVSCMLAIFVLLDRETHIAKMLPYPVVAVSLAAMNCFIASDAVDRILRVDRNNPDLRLAVARKTLGHFRRKRLPWLASWSKARVWSAGLAQILLLSLLIVVVDAMLTDVPPVSAWAGHYLVVAAAQGVLFCFFAMFVWARTRLDSTEQWLSGFLFLCIASAGAILALSLDPTQGVVHALSCIGIPCVIFVASMRTTTHKKGWWIPSWVPGTWVRIPAALAVSNAIRKAEEEIATAKRLRERAPAGALLHTNHC